MNMLQSFSEQLELQLAKDIRIMVELEERPVTLQTIIESYNRLANGRSTLRAHTAVVRQFQDQTSIENNLTEDERAERYIKWLDCGSEDVPDPFLITEEEQAKRRYYHPDAEAIQKSIAEHNSKSTSEFWKGIRHGFHKAHPEGESEEEKHRKGEEAQKHFRNYLHTKWGLHPKNAANLLSSEIGKLQLNDKVGMKTKGLALAPHTSSGIKHSMCSHSTEPCKEGCLGLTLGNNVAPDVLHAKIARTHYMADHPEHFARLLHHEITEHKKNSEEAGSHAGIRLNTTTDIDWKRHMPKKFFTDYKYYGKHTAANTGLAMSEMNKVYSEEADPHLRHLNHHGVTFYDYTADPSRVKNHPAGDHERHYHETLSHKGPGTNDKAVADHLSKGGVAAMIYHAKMNYRDYSEGKTRINKAGKRVRVYKITPINMPHTAHDVANDKYYKTADGLAHDANFLAHKEAGVDFTHGSVGKDHEGKRRKYGRGVVRMLPFKGTKSHKPSTAGLANRVHDDDHGVLHFNYPPKPYQVPVEDLTKK